MNDRRSIGLFDSGVGGLSIWKELIRLMPYESTIYFADSANVPYGPKDPHKVIEFSESIVEYLLEQNVKMIIVACNTATAYAIDHLRAKYDVPFVGIEPAIKPAALNSVTQKIIVLATEGTFNGRLFQETTRRFATDSEVIVIQGNNLVQLVENNLLEQEETFNYLKELLLPYKHIDYDKLVLGCTHFPFLIPALEKIVDPQVELVNPAPAVVQQAYRVLEKKDLLNKPNNKPEYQFITSGKKESLKHFVDQIVKLPYSIIET